MDENNGHFDTMDERLHPGGLRQKSKVPRARFQSRSEFTDYSSNEHRNGALRITSHCSREQRRSTIGSSVVHTESDTDDNKEWLKLIGERVCISGVKQGVLRYYGRTNFAQGFWCGVELDEPVGKNNGTVNGVVYFSCKPNHGIFAPVSKVSKLNDLSGDVWREQTCSSRHLDQQQSNQDWDYNVKSVQNNVPLERRFIKNSSSDPTFMRQNASANLPHTSRSFSYDKRNITEQRNRNTKDVFTFEVAEMEYKSARTRSSSPPNIPMNSSSSTYVLSKYGYGAKNQLFNSNVACLSEKNEFRDSFMCANSVPDVPKKNNLKMGLKTSKFSSEEYEFLHRTPTNSGDGSPMSSDTKKLNDPQYFDYKISEAVLNSFQVHLAEPDDEMDNDDQISVDYDESLGILTPSQMQDSTLCPDLPISCSDIRGIDFPSSESFDDINDLPEDEQVHDVSVHFLPESAPTSRSLEITKQNNQGSYHKLEPKSEEYKNDVMVSSTNRFLFSVSQKDFPECPMDNRYLAKSNVDESYKFTSSELDYSKKINNLSMADVMLNNTETGERCISDAFNVTFNPLSKICDADKISETDMVSQTGVPSVDTSFSQFSSLSTNTEQNKSSAPVSCYNISDNKKIKMLSLQNFTDESISRKNFDSDSSRDSLLQADVEHNSVLKEKLTVSWEDCIPQNNEYPFTSIERPDSVYTVASSDTGFQEDGEMEAETGMATSMESTESNKRFSTISRDSCIVTEDVDAYKIAESNSTSGYSTGLSDSCCNDRAEDDLSGKPLTDEEIQDSVGHCDSEDAFSFQDTSSISRDGDVVNAGMSDTTGETVLFQDSTSEALCETMVEDATLTEIHDLLLSPEENQSIAHEDKENMAEPERSKPQSPESISKKISDRTPSSTSSKPTPNSTPEKKLNVNNKPKIDNRRQQRVQNNVNRAKSSRICDEEADKKKQLVKSPKKNVMSKIKAMIEATSCKTNNKLNKAEEPPQKKVVSAPKRSRWEAVTSKIAASLAEEKTKPKAKREIRSRVDTNLALARQQASACKSPKLDSRAEGSMSPISVSSRRPLSEKNSAPNSVKDGRINNSKDSKNSAKSPRPGRISSRSASPVAPSESSTSLSVNSHSKIAHWKGSSSTVASSAAPTTSMVKRQPAAPPTTKPPLQTTRSAAARMTAKKPTTATAPKIYLTVPKNSRIRSLSPSASSTRAERTTKQPRKTKEQAGPRGAPNTSRPVRPPMWLSKAELTQEIQRLSSLCEIRTKELNRLKMETKHVSMGFDAFSALFKYMVEDLNALSVPNLAADLDSTLKKLELTKQDLAYYEREVEEIKAHHCQELNDLSNKLFEVYQTEVAELNAKHQEEINQLNDDHQKQLENLSLNFNTSSEEIKAQHEKLISKLEEELRTQREEMRLFQEREIKDLEEKHTQSTKVLQEHIEQLQKKCAELKQHSMSMEDAMRKDTDSKLQWVTSRKVDLEKEVESLKTVLEMKNKELHTLRIQNLEMEKQLEELPFAREKIKMLQARAEDLEALMNEKTKIERKLCSENQEIRDIYEKESKVNRRLSMENEELQWRLRQAEQSLLAGSFPEADETREETDDATTPSSKSSAPPQILSKSVFFTYVDKDESSAFSPRTPYKRITPGFSSSYKTSPGKASKSHLTPSPRKAKSHSEPPLPPSFSSTPRKMSKQASPKGSKKRQKSGSESCPHPEENEIILSVTESMASSVSSENSIPEQKETLLEEHKEHIMASLEIIREQRNTHDSNEVQMSQSMIEQQVSRPSNFEIDMSRSAEFADPKSYYHMTFAVPKEPGMGDGDTDSSKVSSCNSSKEITPVTMHSISESSLSYNQQKNTDAIKINISTTEISTSETVNSNTENESTQIKPAHSDENFQKEENACDIADHWRTI